MCIEAYEMSSGMVHTKLVWMLGGARVSVRVCGVSECVHVRVYKCIRYFCCCMNLTNNYTFSIVVS